MTPETNPPEAPVEPLPESLPAPTPAPAPVPSAQETTQPRASVAPTATTEAEPVSPWQNEKGPAKAPAGWSTITLAFSPSGRSMRVLDKTQSSWEEDEQPFDPEAHVRACIQAWQDDVSRDAEAVAIRSTDQDAILVYHVQLLRKGRTFFQDKFHTRLTAAFSAEGAFYASERVQSALAQQVHEPLLSALEAEIRRVLPGVLTRSPRGTPAKASPSTPTENAP